MTRDKPSIPGTQDLSKLCWGKDRQGRKVIDSAATLQTIGRTQEEVMGNSWSMSSVENRLRMSLKRHEHNGK